MAVPSLINKVAFLLVLLVIVLLFNNSSADFPLIFNIGPDVEKLLDSVELVNVTDPLCTSIIPLCDSLKLIEDDDIVTVPI